ncbi:MAG: UbiA prenyltransferase family protein [Synergistales bacterium]|nr:UbiA prenyltransferase family protein [Synergistales bacterium]
MTGVPLRTYLELLRAYQWVKNLFVFAPLFFAFRFTELDLFFRSALAFAAFCCIASFIYVVNDLKDLEIDRRHPAKRFRPLAAGRIAPHSARIAAALSALAGFGLAIPLGPEALLLLLGYAVLNLLYSLGLKEFALIDIFIVAAGFPMRVFLGGFATDIPLSRWIIVMTFLLALFLVLAKRRDDILLVEDTVEVRESVQGYNLTLVDTSMAIVAAVTLVAYLMYCFSPEVIAKAGSEHLYITGAFVLMGILRFLQLTLVRELSGAPTHLFLEDRFLQITVMAWLLTFVILHQ